MTNRVLDHPLPAAKNCRKSHSPRLKGEKETQAEPSSLTQKGLAKKNLKKTNSKKALPFQSGHELGIRDRGQHASAPIKSHTYKESKK
jgi:hypothetical protein